MRMTRRAKAQCSCGNPDTAVDIEALVGSYETLYILEFTRTDSGPPGVPLLALQLRRLNKGSKDTSRSLTAWVSNRRSALFATRSPRRGGEFVNRQLDQPTQLPTHQCSATRVREQGGWLRCAQSARRDGPGDVQEV